MNLKTCTRCERSLPADTLNFNLRSYSSTRLRCWCKPCEAEQKLERKAEIADRAAQRQPAGPPALPPQSRAGLDLATVWRAARAPSLPAGLARGRDERGTRTNRW